MTNRGQSGAMPLRLLCPLCHAQALRSLQQAQHEMASARAEAEASRKLAASEASQLESRAASMQAEAAVATEQRIGLAARLREMEQREVGGGVWLHA